MYELAELNNFVHEHNEQMQMSNEIECEISTADDVKDHEYDDENDLSDVDVNKENKFMNAKRDDIIARM